MQRLVCFEQKQATSPTGDVWFIHVLGLTLMQEVSINTQAFVRSNRFVDLYSSIVAYMDSQPVEHYLWKTVQLKLYTGCTSVDRNVWTQPNTWVFVPRNIITARTKVASLWLFTQKQNPLNSQLGLSLRRVLQDCNRDKSVWRNHTSAGKGLKTRWSKQIFWPTNQDTTSATPQSNSHHSKQCG